MEEHLSMEEQMQYAVLEATAEVLCSKYSMSSARAALAAIDVYEAVMKALHQYPGGEQ